MDGRDRNFIPHQQQVPGAFINNNQGGNLDPLKSSS